MSVYGVINCYNDWPLIEAAVSSISHLVDLIVAVDGRYSDFEQINGSDISTDGTLEYLERHNDVHISIVPNLSEVHKRNCYLMGQPGDYYLQLDADEVWHGPLEIPDADMGIVRLKWRKTGNWMDRVRLWRHVPGQHYEGKHYILKDDDGRTFARLEKPGKSYSAARLEKNWIEHFDEDRPPQRQTLKRTYYRTLVKRENQIMEVS